MKSVIKIFLCVFFGIIGFIFISIPAEHWLPFASDFPSWMVKTPLLHTAMRSGPLIGSAIFITVLIYIFKEFKG